MARRYNTTSVQVKVEFLRARILEKIQEGADKEMADRQRYVDQVLLEIEEHKEHVARYKKAATDHKKLIESELKHVEESKKEIAEWVKNVLQGLADGALTVETTGPSDFLMILDAFGKHVRPPAKYKPTYTEYEDPICPGTAFVKYKYSKDNYGNVFVEKIDLKKKLAKAKASLKEPVKPYDGYVSKLRLLDHCVDDAIEIRLDDYEWGYII
jgi:hypothetical protein